MKFLLIILSLLLSFFALAEEHQVLCLTHGQCQTKAQETNICPLVQVGRDPSGNSVCIIRCFQSKTGQFCEKIEGKEYGVCREETYTMPDSNSTDCSNALPMDIAEEIFI